MLLSDISENSKAGKENEEKGHCKQKKVGTKDTSK